MNRKKRIQKGLQTILCFTMIGLSAFLLALSHHLKTYFNSTYFEQLLYNLLNTTTLDLESLETSIAKITLETVILIAIFSIPLILKSFLGDKKKIQVGKRKLTLFEFSFKKYAITILGISILIVSICTGIPNFIKNNITTSTLYEDYYVPYQSENLIFPKEKQNLIMIFVESFETSNFNKENGGTVQKSYAPKLEKLAEEYINFSNTNQLGGFKRVNGTDWTIAGMVAQTSGIPIYIKTKNKQGNFLQGATSTGDILLENGYKNYLLIGSDAKFGERKNYFTEHGNYEIHDYNDALKTRKIPYQYHVWWGYEDQKLYEFAKQELLKISNKEETFNFTMLTADTHFFDGYLEATCPNQFSEKYANTFYCTDIMLTNFISWIQTQDFYKNTTIIIVGDHLGMRNNFYQIEDDYEQTVFNLFINSKVTTNNTKIREFTAFDIFPTTLAALGVEIKNERLALGTNLFSGEKTLTEELGYDTFAKEVQKKSNYYKTEIIK